MPGSACILPLPITLPTRNKALSLTDKPTSKTLHSKSRWWFIGVITVLILAVVFILLRDYLSEEDFKPSGEEQMPAIKVIVSNGCGYEDLASTYAQYIGTKNIEVIKLSDTPKPIYDKSIIVARTPDEEDLKRLQAMTGIQRHTMALMDDPEAPFTIILGRDYQEFIKKK